MKKRMTLSLRKESWDWIFTVIGEYSLVGPSDDRISMLKENVKEFNGPSLGNFWALIQELQGQYEEIYGEHPPTNYIDYYRENSRK